MKTNSTRLILPIITIFVLVGCSSGGGDSADKKRSKIVTVQQEDFDNFTMSFTEQELLDVLNKYDHRSLLTNSLIKEDIGSSLFIYLDESITSGTGCDFQNLPRFTRDSNGEFQLSVSADYLVCQGGSGGSSDSSVLPPGTTATSMYETLEVKKAVFMDNGFPVDVTGEMWTDVAFPGYDIYKINLKYGWSMAGTQSGQSLGILEKIAIYATDNFDEPCIFQDTLITNCTIEYIDSFDYSSSFGDEEVVSFEYDDVVPSDTASNGIDLVYFASGTIRFKINNWTGTLLYTAPDIAPLYSATDGDQTVEGTLVLE